MKVFNAILSVLTLVMVLAYAITLWSMGKTRERTACYRQATSIEQCEPPGPVERLVRRALG